MKKVIAAALLILIAATLLTGCQSEEEKRRQKAKEMTERIMGSEPSNYKTETVEEATEKAKKFLEKVENEKKK